MNIKYTIQDLVDVDRLRVLFENFSETTGFTIGFLSYPEQELLITTGWRDICTKFHRVCPASAECCKESNVYLTACLKDHKELNIKPCGNGLVDGATPVIVRGMQIATLATGQVLLAPPDIQFFKGLAAKYGFDTDKYLEALDKVPVVSEKQLKSALAFLSCLAAQIAEEGMTRLQILEGVNDLRKAKEEVDRRVAERTVELEIVNTQLQIELAEHNVAKEGLRLSNSKFQAVLDNSRDCIYRLNLQTGYYDFLSPSSEMVMGFPLGELITQTVDDRFALIHPCDMPALRAGMERLEETGETDIEYRQRVKNGDYRWFSARISLTRDDAGQPMCRTGNIRDISRRKEGEQALQQAQAKLQAYSEDLEKTVVTRTEKLRKRTAELQTANASLRESEERFRQMSENSHEVFWLKDNFLNQVLYVSPSYEQIWGFPRERLFKTPHVWIGDVHPEDREKVGAASQWGDGENDSRTREFRIVRPDGSIRWISDTVSPVRDRTGRVYRVTGISHDITEKVQMQKEILEISDFERHRFNQDIQAEISQALEGVALRAKMIAHRLNLASNPEAISVHTISRLIERIALNSRSLAKTLYPSQMIAEGVITGLGALAAWVERSSGIPCEFEYLTERILHDEKQAFHLYRIAQELLMNAAKHSKATRLALCVTCEAGVFELAVSDNGIGLDSTSNKQGMGMKIMHYRAHQIGAALNIQSSPETGTRVVCSLPLPEEKSMLPASLSSNSSLKIDFMTLGDHGLTPRECEVMQWIAQGKRDGEIAIILSISRRTISHHVARILQKFGVETRTGAMSRAIDLLS